MKSFQSRANLIAFFFVLGALAIVIQVVRIQNSKEADSFRTWGKEIMWQYETLPSERGKIFDQHMHMLAGNKVVYEVGITLKDVKNANTVAMTLNTVLGKDYKEILDLLTNPPAGAVYRVIDQYVDADKTKQLKDLQSLMKDKYRNDGDPSLAGLGFYAHQIRSYPDKSLASNVIGFVNLNNQGNYGIEQKYDSLLAGVPKQVLVPKDPNLITEMPKNPSGADLILTIDRDIQSMVETELKKGVQDTGATAGTIVVMDPRTGAILAMASTPQMDLNDYTKFGEIYKTAGEFNRAVSVQFEPGSIFKILTMSAAIDSGRVVPSSTYLDTGFYPIGGVNIVNWDHNAWGVQDMVGCLQHSLNVCMARLADLMGQNTFYTYMRRFGIGYATNIDLSNEAIGHLKDPADTDWSKVDLGTNSFGQGVSVSPIQMMTAATALANDGKMVYPHVVYAMVSNGSEHITPTQILGTPISPQSARTVSNMLADALQAGQSLANVKGYRIAGKTGTASIPGPDGVYDPNLTNQSFMGWGPVDDPKFMVFVWMERPLKSDWASYVASPIFHDVVQKLVVLMDIPPDDIRKQLLGQ